MSDRNTTDPLKTEVLRALAAFSCNPESSTDPTIQQAVYLARRLQARATELQTPAERRQQSELDRMIQTPGDKTTLLQLTDQAFRSRLPHRAADQLIHILDLQGIPRFFSTFDRTLLRGFQSFGSYLPGVAIPLVQEKMHQETANVVLPAEEDHLRDHLRKRWREGVRMNVNFLGEALLGEGEASRRLQNYLQALQRPEIEVISVKISTLYSQIHPLAHQHSVDVLSDRMELLYRAAVKNWFEAQNGTRVHKFVYLDMEEYRDKEITADVFMQTLDRPGLQQAPAGIVLQAYIPDSFSTQQRITQWAKRRVQNGGVPITIRLVKGANMEMERVEACERGWETAPFHDKLDTDANYARMLQYGMRPENLAGVRLGIATHNLFTVAYGLALAARANVLQGIQFEMLEGMANHQRRALFQLTENVLLYAPACKRDEFINAIGYLVRRLDENTGPNNFLRHAFRLRLDSTDWCQLEEAFLKSFSRLDQLPSEPRRKQNRIQEPLLQDSRDEPLSKAFSNEPDTDWSLAPNRQWASALLEHQLSSEAIVIPLVIDGKEISSGRSVQDSFDPSRPDVVVARYLQGSAEDTQQAVQCAVADSMHWRSMPAADRAEILQRVATQIAGHRNELLGALLADAGKTLAEGDPEISEAIDFCRFYAQTACEFSDLKPIRSQGRGVVVVVSPWNFPLAIPCGGIAAALAAGNTVILKPAPDTVLVAYRLCQCFWRAGVPSQTLQFLPCSSVEVAEQLVTDSQVNVVILTGSTQTALRMLAAKPTMNLLAETGGKNATIVTALADRDLAIKNVLHSAFSHSGQKCSATSLLILEEEVFHDTKFRETLCDAVESLTVGSAWQPETKIGPLIRPPGGALERSLKELEDGESWAVMPRLHVQGNPNLVGPGLKWGVQPGSFTHSTELFGPLLGVMPARNLHEAIDLVNATGYGLTSGLESLDDREQRLWTEGIQAGNLYLNRPTTGAVVLRQPFGGVGKSAIGPGLKAGGVNYVASLLHFWDPLDQDANNLSVHSVSAIPEQPHISTFLQALHQIAEQEPLPEADVDHIQRTIDSFRYWMDREFAQNRDPVRLIGEDNCRWYQPFEVVRIRVHANDSRFDLYARTLAARIAGCRSVISIPVGFQSSETERLDRLTESWAGAIEFVIESDTALSVGIQQGDPSRLRYANPERVPKAIRTAAAQTGTYIADTPVSSHGRIELLWYFQEQTLSHVYHRYGNLGNRSDEPRKDVN